MKGFTWARAALFAAAALGSTLPTMGCAAERAPINRVQANALAKKFFVGELTDPADDPEFYMRVTVVDAPMGAGNDGLFTASDSQPTTRIRWEITEHLLLARLTYELVDHTDGKGARRTPDGQVVAAYDIQSHFDIRRDYNESTGEESNVIVENDADRPWYQRDYFRVDWSKNLITDAYDLDTLSQIGIWYGVKWDPVAYYVAEPGSPDAPVFDVDRGYFDVTNKAFASPEILEDEWGPFPACWLYGGFPTTNCNPSEITLRQSFLRVEDHDYEPLDFDGVRMDMFGWFTVDRFGYDRRYGVVDDQWHRFATRWNIYERSHAQPTIECATAESAALGLDPHRDDDGSGTEDECEGVGRGSRCDEFRGECTLPMRDRAIKTIPWHVSPEFPEELFEGSAKALDTWSETIRLAVITARLAECRRTHEQGCETTMGWPARWSGDYSPPVGSASPAEVPKVFVLCHNPVDPAKGDDASCGAAGSAPRLGDLRYNILAIINEPQDTSPWGIMVDAEDPLTGEKIAGSANQWGAVLDRAAGTLVDLLALLNGEIDPEDYIQGQNVSDWVEANQPGGPAEHARAMSAEEIASRKAAFDPAAIAPYLAGIGAPKPGAPPALRHKARLDALLDQGRLGPGNAELATRMKALRGTPIEAKLVSPEMAQAAGYDPTASPTAEAIDRASPFGRMSPVARRDRERAGRIARARRHSCRLEAPEPDNLLGMAKLAAQLFPAPDPSDKAAVNKHRQDVYLWARQQYNQGVLAHELGHSMGLRHNFAGSFDSLNYEPRYWQLRTHNGAITADCPDGNTDGASCVGPRWRDPVSQEEIDGNIGRYATTSVMDYPGDQNQDQLLPGKYDAAAVRFGYGGTLDVWSADGLSVNGSGAGKRDAYYLTGFATSPGLFGVYYFPPVDPAQPYKFIHYSRYQSQFSLISNCQPSSDPDAVLGQKCDERAMDVVDFRDMEDFASDPDYAAYSWALSSRAVEKGTGRVRRGYMFSSDEYADVGNVPSFSDDAGADAYEQVRFLEAGYENRYILDAFRRDRVKFTSEGVIERIQARYLDNIQQIGKTFAFGAVLDGDPAAPTDEFLADGYYGPLSMAATVGLDLFSRVLTRPEPGYYCEAQYCGGYTPVGVDEKVFVADSAALPDVYLYDFRVGLGDGRYLHNDYDYSQGYWWGDYQTQVGAYYEKVWTTYYLAEAFDYFVSNSKEDFTDSRYKNVNFMTVYPEQVRRLYGSLLTGDLAAYAPWVEVPANPNDTPDGTLVYPTWHEIGGPAARPAGVLLADPNYAFNEQIYAMVWGAMYFPTNWSQSWVHDARITLLSGEQVGWAPAETYAFYHPASGLTYRAHAIGTEGVLGQTVQRGVGARMLEWANKLVTIAYLVQKDGNGDPIVNADGTPALLLDVDGKPQKNPASPGADAVLKKFVDEIDLFRQLTSTFNQGLGDDDLPQP